MNHALLVTTWTRMIVDYASGDRFMCTLTRGSMVKGQQKATITLWYGKGSTSTRGYVLYQLF